MPDPAPKRVLVLTPEQVRDITATRRFWQTISRRPLVTYALLAVLLAAAILTGIVGEGGDDNTALLQLGAKVNALIALGQTYRLMSAVLLHAGVLHLVLNGYALYVLGRLLEGLLGPARYFTIFVASGVFSSLASYLGADQMSVGASGAIFGLLGAGVTYGLRHRTEIPPAFRRYYGAGLMPWVVLNLAMGFLIPQIDNYAHAGGLFAGVVLALLLDPPVAARDPWWRRTLLSLATLAALIEFGIGAQGLVLGALDKATLPAPAAWRSVHVAPAWCGAFPARMRDIGEGGRTAQAIEEGTGFWMAAQFKPVPGVVVDKRAWLEAELKRDEGDSIRDVEWRSEAPARLGSREATRFTLRYRVAPHPIPFTLDVYLSEQTGGLASLTCSAPEMLYPLVRSWCEQTAARFGACAR